MNKIVLKGGIVGCGTVAMESHVPAWRSQKDADIVAICDEKEDAAYKVASHFAASRVYRDFDKMLRDEELDFIDICTPPLTHCRLSTQAMEAGLNVVIEKPMAVTSKEAEYMAFSAQNNDVKLCVIHNFLFTPAVLAAKSMIANGKIGDLISVHATMCPSKERLNSQGHWYHSLPGGILHEFAPHVVYMASAFLGKIHPVGVISKKLSQFPWVNADELKVMVESENRIGVLTISFNQPRFSSILDIYGSKGTLRIDNLAQTITFTGSRSTSTAGLIMVRLETLSQLIPAIASVSIRSLLGQKWYKLGHQAIIQGFIESIRENKETPITEYDGLETTKVLESILNKMNI